MSPGASSSSRASMPPGSVVHPSKIPRGLGQAFRFGLAGVASTGLILLFWLRVGIYHHCVSFPREAAAWQAIRAQRQPVFISGPWTEYRGILHSHSKLSHDCEVPFEEILSVLKRTGLDFICLSDHPIAGRADFDLQWRGLHQGKLFIPGFEMKEGMMPFGVNSGIVLSNQTPAPVLAGEVARNGGLLFYAHPEETRAWDEPNLVGMEIYNLHSDLKRQKDGLRGMLPDLILNRDRYPEQLLHRLFVRPTEFLRRWDDLNRTRHLTGIAGNDCHQNTGFRAFCTESNTLRIEDTSPRTLREIHLNWFTRLLARLLFGPLTPGRKLFHVELDPYDRSARYVNTHVLAQELSEPALLHALQAGRVFIGFDLIADSSGFRWMAHGSGALTVMGESVPYAGGLVLRASSPLPCRFTIVKDGMRVYQALGRNLEWSPPGSGKYRVEAELKILNQWVPWVYANPIELL